jgi:A/G-specific adenine glycosylase
MFSLMRILFSHYKEVENTRQSYQNSGNLDIEVLHLCGGEESSMLKVKSQSVRKNQEDNIDIPLDPVLRNRLRRKLVNWFGTSQRDLPWRKTKDPYPIWISEVMLQQTQVQTVIPYYSKFLKAFPSVARLAEADPQHLLRVWAGLGYYSRVRNLQKSAQKIVRTHGGRFPHTYSEVLALPGVGRYTAGAVLSIAFDQPFAVLDGNVTRVLTRLFGLKGDPKNSVLQTLLWKLAQVLLPRKSPGDFNQALMELGATLCLPRKPQCLLCPWQAECHARKEGTQELLPEKRKPITLEKSLRAVAVILRRGRILVVKRTNENLLRDLWEFPGGEFEKVEDLRSALVKKIRDDLGLRIRILDQLTTVKYSITNRQITLHVFQAVPKNPMAATNAAKIVKWVRLFDVKKFPFASASLQILQALRNKHNGQPVVLLKCQT